ncbi:STAS domain-containing protein [Streptomyces sp. NPDC005648]|uniref:STAS domain-containing protein n=1 Tax=Streptomyces sp. NPDC005648 TaxID=3157044 RepID=UPI0033BB9795
MAESDSGPAPVDTVRLVADTTVVALRGELDLLAVPRLGARLDELSAPARPDLVLDLRAVSFIDCSGLGVLCRTRNRVTARDGRLRLVTRSPDFVRMLRPVGLAGAFEMYARLSDALTPAPGDDLPAAAG